MFFDIPAFPAWAHLAYFIGPKAVREGAQVGEAGLKNELVDLNRELMDRSFSSVPAHDEYRDMLSNPPSSRQGRHAIAGPVVFWFTFTVHHPATNVLAKTQAIWIS
jgi:hypothetical protein